LVPSFAFAKIANNENASTIRKGVGGSAACPRFRSARAGPSGE
jgi:hypothetical protein